MLKEHIKTILLIVSPIILKSAIYYLAIDYFKLLSLIMIMKIDFIIYSLFLIICGMTGHFSFDVLNNKKQSLIVTLWVIAIGFMAFPVFIFYVLFLEAKDYFLKKQTKQK